MPKGVSSGNYMTQRGEGNYPPNGGEPGNLIVYFDEKNHNLFVRDGVDVLLSCWLQYPQAVFGTSIEVPTLSGKVKLKIPAGIKSGQILRLRAKGMPELNRNYFGDQLVKINIETPKKISKKTKLILEDLSMLLVSIAKEAGITPVSGVEGKVEEEMQQIVESLERRGEREQGFKAAIQKVTNKDIEEEKPVETVSGLMSKVEEV